MPFQEAWSNRIYRIVREIVENSNFTCRRADEYFGRVVLEDVWQRLNEAAFVIADLTANNPNVYYELGIAHALGKEIIPIIQSNTQIPFDQQPFRVLVYEDNADGYEVLSSRLPGWISSLEYNSSPQVLLRRGLVHRFNDWRTLHQFVDLSNADLSNLDLSEIDFSGVLLRGVILRESNLNSANISGAKLTSADLRSVKLDKCTGRKSHMSEATMIGASIHNADLAESVIIRSDLTDVLGIGVNLCGANLSESILTNADLRNSDLRDGIWLRVRIDGADLHGANVSGLTVEKATWDRYRLVFQTANNPEEVIIEHD